MAITLTIKQVPEALARRLRARAESNHRSIQGELMAMLEDAFRPETGVEQPRTGYRVKRKLNGLVEGRPAGTRLTIAELWEMGRKAGLRTPSESTRIIREARDGRNRR